MVVTLKTVVAPGWICSGPAGAIVVFGAGLRVILIAADAAQLFESIISTV